MNNGPSTPKGSPEFDAALANARTPDEVREATHKFFGLPNDVDYRQENAYAPITPQPAAPLPVPSSGSHIRVIYPSGNSRFEIYGDSEESLDVQEQRIRALYGSQR
jgi:hypothetical protein